MTGERRDEKKKEVNDAEVQQVQEVIPHCSGFIPAQAESARRSEGESERAEAKAQAHAQEEDAARRDD
jgi:hypothetical protein